MLKSFDFLGKGSLKGAAFEVTARCLLRLSSATGDVDTVLGMSAAADGLIVGTAQGRDDPDSVFRCLARARALRPEWPALVEVGYGGGGIDAELDALMPARPHGIVLADAGDGVAVQHLGAKLAVREAMLGLPDGGTRILAVAASRAAFVPDPQSYVGASSRLVGLVWDQARFAADIAVAPPTAPQRLSIPLLVARAAVVMAARAAGVPAYEAGSRLAGVPLRAECRRARRDGFTGKVALDAAQIRVILAAFDSVPA